MSKMPQTFYETFPRTNNGGFGIVELFITLFIVGLIGAASLYIVQSLRNAHKQFAVVELRQNLLDELITLSSNFAKFTEVIQKTSLAACLRVDSRPCAAEKSTAISLKTASISRSAKDVYYTLDGRPCLTADKTNCFRVRTTAQARCVNGAATCDAADAFITNISISMPAPYKSVSESVVLVNSSQNDTAQLCGTVTNINAIGPQNRVVQEIRRGIVQCNNPAVPERGDPGPRG